MSLSEERSEATVHTCCSLSRDVTANLDPQDVLDTSLKARRRPHATRAVRR